MATSAPPARVEASPHHLRYVQCIMRTTVTLDDDVAAQLAKAMKDSGLGFKEALNQALRRGLGASPPRARKRYRVRVFDTGAPLVPLDNVAQALAVAEGEDFG